jgi:hypothetical protein
MNERLLRRTTLAGGIAIFVLTMGRWAGVGHEQLSAILTLAIGALLVALVFGSKRHHAGRTSRVGTGPRY